MTNSATAISEGNPASARKPMELQPFNHVSILCPRFWHGMEPNDFGKLAAEHRWKVDRWPTTISCLLATGGVWALNLTQRLICEKKIEATPLKDDPVFVLGHWRSGTTLLQDLTVLDTKFRCPNTFECFTPRGFLTSDFWLKPVTSFTLPDKRPMDNMRMGWDAPMEDEFALLVMGLPTTYRRIAFPNEIPRHLDYLNMDGVPQPEIDRWKAALNEFVKNLNYRYGQRGQRLLLKSPPHTGRVKILQELYPNARFVHITRNPLKFIPSTIHMWAALDHVNALQNPNNERLREFVFDSFDRLYKGYERDQALLTKTNSIEVRFDELVRDHVGVMRRVYDQLDLGDFDRDARSAIEARMEKSRSYKQNTHNLPEDLQDEILHRCGDYMSKYGYSAEQAAA